MIARAIADPATLSGLIAIQEATGFHHRCALAGDLRLIDVPPGWRIARDALWESAKPTVIVLGDDAGASDGPADFPDAERVMRWANRLMVHATGAERKHYDWCAAAAMSCRRVLLVETTTRAEAAWMHAFELEQERRDSAGETPLATLLLQCPAHLPPHPLAGRAAA